MKTQNLKCECDITSSEINVEKNNDIGSKSLYKSFYDVLKFSNYKVLKCYKLAFSKTIFSSNYGNYISLAYFVIFFIFLLIYLIKGRTELKNDITNNINKNKSKEINNNNFKSGKLNIENSENKINSKTSSKYLNLPDENNKNIYI